MKKESKGNIITYTTDTLICLTCIHAFWFIDPKTKRQTCMAFPHDIPDEILEEKNDHSKPIKGQFGDYVYDNGGEEEED